MLETRDGSGTQGWSFAAGGLVPTAEADLHVSSFDCGARGRWVTLDGADGVELCTASGCSRSLPAGGSDGAFHEDFEIRRGDTVLARACIVRETPTPRDWYVQNPTPPFQVVLWLTPAE